MKKVIKGLGMLFCLLSLSGCRTNQKASTDASEKQIKVSETRSNDKKSEGSDSISSRQSSSEETTNSSSSSEPEDIWNSKKASHLQAFMNQWGDTMDQTYKEYQPQNSVDFYGLKLPDEVLGDQKREPIAVDDQIVSVKWSDNGAADADYSVVAVYSDAETAEYMDKHVYFFAFHEDQPVVLVSMQNQGMPDGALHFKETDNQDLKTAFQSIVNEKAVEQPVQDNNSWSSMDEAIQFYEATFKNPSNKVSKEIAWENYDRACWSLEENTGNRILLHWSNISGAGGSYDEFIKKSDTTELITYGGNAAYPDNPSMKYTIQNSDHKVIETEKLWDEQ